MLVSILLLIITTSGVFISSGCFVDAENDIKRYLILIPTSILLLLLTFYKKTLSKFKKAIENKTFSYGLVIICLFLSIQGILQYLEILKTNNINFAISGSFENPAGFAATNSLLFTVSIYQAIKQSTKKIVRIIIIGISALAFVTTILSGSRCGVLAMSTTILIMLFTETRLKNIIKKHKWVYLLLVLFIIGFTLFLYFLKKDSANGRILIWNICLKMIKESPFFGYGHNGFRAHYMSFQAEYFMTHDQSAYSILADNINHPFNEYIKLLVEYGLLCFLLVTLLQVLIIRIILKHSNAKKGLGLSLISTIFIMSMFSYPFNYIAFTYIAILILILALPIKELPQKKVYSIIKYIVRIIIILIASFYIYDCYYNIKWARTYKQSLNGDTKNALSTYKNLMSKISYNPYFLYNYSAELNFVKKYSESNNIAKKYIEKLNDYDVQLLLANNYFNLQKYDEAIKKYKTASYMVPSRFVPLGNIMNLYLLKSDTIKAVRVAEEILSKKIKIPSSDIYKIRQEAENLLSNYGKKVEYLKLNCNKQ